MNTKHRVFLPAALVALFSFAACGDDGGDASGTVSTGTDASSTATSETGTSSSTTTVGSSSESGSESSSGSSESGSESSSSGGPVEFDPVELDCPTPDSLPFMTETNVWANAAAQTVADENPRIKDEAADILGNPGGLLAYTTMSQGDPPAADLNIFEGRKQRTINEEGLLAEPLPQETVSLWGYNGEWYQAAGGLTDDLGGYSFPGVELSANPNQAFYAILEGEQSCSAHYMLTLDPGTKVVVADIDGTLTLSDDEFTMQIMDGTYDPLEMGAAPLLMQTWSEKGYWVIYITARPHAFRAESRVWLRDHGFPAGAVITANSLVFGESARDYKATWVNRIRDDFGWEVTAAYGNAESDILAFDDGGIPKEITFIVGENAGNLETQAIEDLDYTTHIADFVDPQPDA